MKEALNNAVKYSEAKQVAISLKFTGNAYKLCVADDGKGIEEGVVQGSGNGMSNMHRRMESVQGCCTVTSAPGKGTEVCCSGYLY
jgi:signal transduction histidine kinase